MVNYTDIFHTVPFSASNLHRLENGKDKNNPGFPDNWTQFSSKRNTKNTPVLGAIAREDFIGVDIDNTAVFIEALDIDPDCEYIAKSDLKGGHMLYAYHDEDAEQLMKISKDAKKANIDLQMGNKLIYLATPANTTKELLTEPLKQLPQRRIPSGIMNLIHAHTLKVMLESPEMLYSTENPSNYNRSALDNSTLGYMLEADKFDEKIIDKVIPRKLEFRHPKDVPAGFGTDWMNSVRFKLAQDPSVSEEKFISFMLFLNSLWDDPMDESRVLNDCKYDIKTRINSVTGDILWKYNEDWKSEGFIYPNKFDDAIEVMYDSEKALFLEYNDRTGKSVIFTKQTDIINSILSNSRKRMKIKGETILKKADTISILDTPELLPGKIKQPGEFAIFNRFSPSEGVMILKGIKEVKEPKYPKTILKFFENLIIDEDNRMRFFQFIAKKHITYQHSELYFVFAGVAGAGKGICSEVILSYFASPKRMQEVNLDKMTNNFNSWMGVTDYAVLDEAGEGASKLEQAKLVGELKNRTGKSTINITFKGKEAGESQRHYITPILTTNMNTKLVTDGASNDRRMVLFKCPNKLTKITDDTTEFVKAMEYELQHFAHYLKNLPEIHPMDYRNNENWKNNDYFDYIATTIAPIDRILEAVELNDLDRMLEILTDDIGVPAEVIDEIFSLSKEGEEARMLLYNTTGSRCLNTKSLADVADTTTLIDAGEVRSKLKQFKKKVIAYDMGNKVNTVVVPFKKAYTKMTSIAPLEEED